MKITLSINHSEVNKVKKNLTNKLELSGTLRNESNVVSPDILIHIDNPSGYNYCYIPQFNRHYFIHDMTAVRAGIWWLHLESDPLTSFADELLKCNVILDETTSGGSDYLPGRNWVVNCKNITDIINFPGGLLENGEFILITAGG